VARSVWPEPEYAQAVYANQVRVQLEYTRFHGEDLPCFPLEAVELACIKEVERKIRVQVRR
jgi:hypothetical protein